MPLTWWLEIASKIAVVLTLIILVWYAWETRKMAKATVELAKSQEKELAHIRRPEVVFGCFEPRFFQFQTTMNNVSIVSAKARVKATISIDGKIMQLRPANHYAGNRIWHIHAAGREGSTFVGHLDFDNVFTDNGINNIDYDKVQAQVTLEAWVINFQDDEKLLYDDANKVPVGRWDWNRTHRMWVPEIAPE